jgi:S-DNA-T family DNA segregation ATPase FtsK/SpoIIIE
LTPTQNRRWNELVGLIWMSLALLLLLSLVSFSASDPSFDTASSQASVHNWVGTVGSHVADLTYQLFGACSFLLPLAFAWVGGCWFRSQPPLPNWGKRAGAALLFLSLPAALALIPYSLRIREIYPAGGLAGRLLADLLRGWLNGPGSAVFMGLLLVVSVYLLTAFSVETTSTWLRPHVGRMGRLRAALATWQEARAAKRRSRQEPGTPQPPIQMPQPAATARAAAGSSTQASADFDSTVIPIQVPVRSSSASRAKPVPVPAPYPDPRISHSYRLPSTTLLLPPDGPQPHAVEDLKRLAVVLTSKCEEFDVHGTVTQINPGPVVTTYEFKPEAGVKYNRITNLVDDLCLAMEAESILIERIPGKSTVGIEVANPQRETIVLREILESEAFVSARSPLTVALGKEINGRIRVADLVTMPHLLIAGSTGSGKSVSINSLIVSILYKATPEDVKLILVDPKRLELGLYEGIPHLVTPIITDPKVAANALRNSVKEMERRLKLLAEKGVRNIEQYNKLFDKPESLNLFEPQNEHQRLPYMVIFIDELADLMMVDSNSVEYSITRLAQMARAVGIHLVLATQRPSVDVITGLIKANFPARISFRVATKVDSRTILDTNGAEALLGKGDMLFSPPGSGRLVRVHGPLVTEGEICQVVEFWRSQAAPSYSEEFLAPPPSEEDTNAEPEEEWTAEKDDVYEQAVRIVVEMGKASTSILQRRLRLGYGRAARLLDIMEKDGIIGPPDGSRPREVLKRPDWFAELERSQTNV